MKYFITGFVCLLVLAGCSGNTSLTNSNTLTNDSVELDTQVQKNCTWEIFNSDKYPLTFGYQLCDWGEATMELVEEGDGIYQKTKLSGDVLPEFPLIQVIQKMPDRTFVEDISSKFIPDVNGDEMTCIVEEVPSLQTEDANFYVIKPNDAYEEFLYSPETVAEVIPNEPCGHYGLPSNYIEKYFQVFSDDANDYYLFVLVDQELPIIDLNTVALRK